MKPTYSEAFIEQALVKLLSRGDRSVQAVATDLNINYHTAKYWIKRALVSKAAPESTSTEPGHHIGAGGLEIPKAGHVCETGQHCQRAATGEQRHDRRG